MYQLHSSNRCCEKKSSQECPTSSRWKQDKYLLIETLYNHSYILICGWKYAFSQQSIWHLQAEKGYAFFAATGYKNDINKNDSELLQPNVDLQAHKNEAKEILHSKSPRRIFWYIFLKRPYIPGFKNKLH